MLSEGFVDAVGGWPAIAGYIIGIIGIITTLVTFRLTKRSRILDWKLTAAQAVLKGVRGKSDASLAIGETRVQEPNLIAVKFINTGREEIPADAFEADGYFRIDFGTDVTHALLVDRISEDVFREGVIDIHSLRGHAVITHVGTLMPGEWFEIQFITTGRLEAPSCEARFAGRTRPMREIVAFKRPTFLQSIAGSYDPEIDVPRRQGDPVRRRT